MGNTGNTGGLVGYNGVDGEIINSYSTGYVNSFNVAGNLVGLNLGLVEDSSASGSGPNKLFGFDDGEVINSFYT